MSVPVRWPGRWGVAVLIVPVTTYAAQTDPVPHLQGILGGVSTAETGAPQSSANAAAAFRVRSGPTPVVTIGGIRGGNLPGLEVGRVVELGADDVCLSDLQCSEPPTAAALLTL